MMQKQISLAVLLAGVRRRYATERGVLAQDVILSRQVEALAAELVDLLNQRLATTKVS